jgi:hypothetical protein
MFISILTPDKLLALKSSGSISFLISKENKTTFGGHNDLSTGHSKGREPVEERVQIYYIPKYKEVFLIKPFIKKVSSISKYDAKGYPIFIIESNVMMTSVRVP